MTETKEEEKVVLHNRGSRVINTPYGQLAIGGSLEVPASAAKALLDYRGVVDAAKLVPQNTQKIDQYKNRVSELEAENARLRKENDHVEQMKKPEPPKAEPAKSAPVAAVEPSDFERTVKAPPKAPVREVAKATKKGR